MKRELGGINGYEVILNNKHGFIDENGHVIIDPKYTEVTFKEDLVLVFDEENNKFKYLNNKGETVWTSNEGKVF